MVDDDAIGIGMFSDGKIHAFQIPGKALGHRISDDKKVVSVPATSLRGHIAAPMCGSTATLVSPGEASDPMCETCIRLAFRWANQSNLN